MSVLTKVPAILTSTIEASEVLGGLQDTAAQEGDLDLEAALGAASGAVIALNYVLARVIAVAAMRGHGRSTS